MAREHLERRDYEKIPPLLKKEEFDLSELYPNRVTFHQSEVIEYHGVVCEYFMGIDENHDTVHELSDMFSDLEWAKIEEGFSILKESR